MANYTHAGAGIEAWKHFLAGPRITAFDCRETGRGSILPAWVRILLPSREATSTRQQQLIEAVLAQKSMRGQGSEAVTVLPGPGAREAARLVELEQWAWRRVRSLRVFYNHATLYVVTNFVILLIDLSTRGSPWFYNVLLGWGLFLGLHALYAYELVPWSTLNWEQRAVRKLIEQRLQK